MQFAIGRVLDDVVWGYWIFGVCVVFFFELGIERCVVFVEVDEDGFGGIISWCVDG